MVRADILGKDNRINSAQEASAMGAAFLAGMQQGAWTADDISRMTAQGEIVHGEENPGLAKRYSQWKELHRMTRELKRRASPVKQSASSALKPNSVK